jgi:7-keto-8-aminopelargonate synthetase-like enzyme
MRGQQGKLKEICDLKSKYNFRLLVDDAHGFGHLVKQVPELVKNRAARIRLMYTSLLLPNQWLVSEHSLRVIKKSSDT